MEIKMQEKSKEIRKEKGEGKAESQGMANRTRRTKMEEEIKERNGTPSAAGK